MVWASQTAASAGTAELASDLMHNAEADHPDHANDVARAVADLRRGDVVLLRDKGSNALVLAAESIDDASFARLRALAIPGKAAPAAPLLATTARRAEALGLACDAGALARIVELRLPADTSPAMLRELADPTIGETQAPEGVTLRPTEADGIAAAAVELAKLARLLPAMVIQPNITREAVAAAEQEGIIALGTAQVRHHRETLAHTLRRVAEARVPLADSADTHIVAFRPSDGGIDHLAIVVGVPEPGQPILARIHSECFTGDLLGSLRCDCGDQLRGAIKAIADSGKGGVVLYLAQEGRGIGLINKLRAYKLQDAGFDTVDANMQLGFDADERIYLPAAEMLRQLGFDKVRLMTNNPEKLAALAHYGIEVVERVPHAFPANSHNRSYLETKARRSGHLF
ncbi:MAG TPA: GTP cyclohydrolase II [Stellaceae bacterium]|nr:GTP cyclohydrolase II [Stellaceae bacterium]